MKMCNENETKYEFDTSHSLLIDFLQDSRTVKDLDGKCIAALTTFLETVVDKEKYLANYQRMFITNCADAMTTSPVESQNNVIHNKLHVRTNLNADKGIKRIAENSKNTSEQQQHKSIRSLNQVNKSSRAPTREHIIVLSQGIADQNFEMAKKMCSAQLSKDEWWCWNFTSSIKEDVEWPLSALPKYRRVRSVKLKSNGKTDFLWCDCGFYGRVGIPCSHVFRISQSMYLENFHVRHWKMFGHCRPKL
jgi:hypothetical protein